MYYATTDIRPNGMFLWATWLGQNVRVKITLSYIPGDSVSDLVGAKSLGL
ncbi:hypothetical protein QJS04_geneDACA014756 [Acorus gramineus]|uniref:Uncharacterized protein n=1 Tax=Acorus gramineus TaxID=55184 RepID=A0AAV9BSJ8_ACOGR|nr:hypothetical protein QJS04_geneDACA014756 [Acorus gramineus]